VPLSGVSVTYDNGPGGTVSGDFSIGTNIDVSWSYTHPSMDVEIPPNSVVDVHVSFGKTPSSTNDGGYFSASGYYPNQVYSGLSPTGDSSVYTHGTITFYPIYTAC